MSPQPTATQAPKAELSMAEVQIERAKKLEKERGELMERISKNRDFLRLMLANEVLTAEQAEWVRTFYPDKEKGEQRSKEAIEATRKLRQEARGGKAES